MSDVDLFEAVSVLRDEVLDTVEHGDRDPPGAEVFDAVLRALAVTGETEGVDLNLHDSAWPAPPGVGDEEVVLADAEMVFDRLMVAVERALRAPERMIVIDAATGVAVTVARVVSLAAVASSRARSRRSVARRNDAAPAQDVVEKQRASTSRHARRASFDRAAYCSARTRE